MGRKEKEEEEKYDEKIACKNVKKIIASLFNCH